MGGSQRKRNLRNAVKSYTKKVLQQINKMGLEFTISQEQIVFKNIRPGAAIDVRRYLTSTAYRQGKIDLWSQAVQVDFSDLAKGW